MNVHEFSDTGSAYDACQIGKVNDGDVLVIESEQVVGVADTWPIAVTVNHGELHTLREGLRLEDSKLISEPVMAAGWKQAVQIAVEKGWQIR
jgi:hypothetical protein